MKPLRLYAIALGIAFLGLVLAPGITHSRRIEISSLRPLAAPRIDLTAWKVLPPKPVLKAQTVRIAPVPQKTPEPQPPKGSVQAQIVALWPGNDSEALKITGCETGQTWNPHTTGRAGERGVFQIHPVHRRRVAAMGYTWDDMYKVEPNVKVAWAIYEEQHWLPWSCKRVL